MTWPSHYIICQCLLVGVGVQGCVFDNSGLPPGTPPDSFDQRALETIAGVHDLTDDRAKDTVPPEAGVDLTSLEIGPRINPEVGPPDGPLSDLPIPDLPVPDLPVPDMPVSDVDSPSCNTQFQSTVPGYQLCSETSTSCQFYYASTTGKKSCTALCAPLACSKMEDNASGKTCVSESPNSCSGTPCTCSSTMNNAICTCTKQ